VHMLGPVPYRPWVRFSIPCKITRDYKSLFRSPFSGVVFRLKWLFSIKWFQDKNAWAVRLGQHEKRFRTREKNIVPRQVFHFLDWFLLSRHGSRACLPKEHGHDQR
jgi:hypothetical protein